MASPTTAPRIWPTCIGPVGLAETYSTLTFCPCPMSDRPYCVPAVRMVRGSPCQTVTASRRLRNPGPATSALAMRGSARNFVASASAMSRGLALAGLASTMAALVAMSPCSGSRGGSVVTGSVFSPSGRSPSACKAAMASSTRARISENRFISKAPTRLAGLYHFGPPGQMAPDGSGQVALRAFGHAAEDAGVRPAAQIVLRSQQAQCAVGRQFRQRQRARLRLAPLIQREFIGQARDPELASLCDGGIGLQKCLIRAEALPAQRYGQGMAAAGFAHALNLKDVFTAKLRGKVGRDKRVVGIVVAGADQLFVDHQIHAILRRL